jgi:tRNA A-37 threonylcarbamoyl transferase component Bud32
MLEKLIPLYGSKTLNFLLNRIRVPMLRALVMSKKEGCIQGLLLDVISDRGTVLERRDDPVALRKRWYNDVAQMLNLLHSAGIVWGDTKPENMLVDEDDNVWLIDFGGGMTDGWVDDENMETKEGDLQGLARFKEFLDLK